MSDKITTQHMPAPPLGNFMGNMRFDALAGFFVFLIAMPLCLAIANASGFPPIAGIWTAVIGGIICTFLSNAELTIKGPAAGLIVIVYGSVTALGSEFATEGMSDADKMKLGYQLSLGIGVTAGIIQVIFGFLRAGRLADFFPLTPVHGLLASIGIIIIAKQIYEVVGVKPTKGAGPLALLAEFPQKIGEMNPEIAIIGLLGLLILFGMPFVAKILPIVKKVPGQLYVLLVAIVLGLVFDLATQHKYTFPLFGEHELSAAYLVTIPNVLSNPSSAFALPDFRGLATLTGMKYLLLFTLIGSLESLLSAKAIELIDPWKRKTNFDRDMIAVGVANTLAAAVGGLPMISEIVRSKANIDNGARTRYSNMYHGLFLLGFVLLFPGIIHMIPLAALGAMLVFTGFRLASPNEFLHAYKLGSAQFVVFVGTVIMTLATDLLIGIAFGIALKIAVSLWHGTSILGLLKADVEPVEMGDKLVTLLVKKSAVFSNWLKLKSTILLNAEGKETIVLDLSRTKFVDHSVMEKLHEMEDDFRTRGKEFKVIGLDNHTPLSNHPMAARKNTKAAELVNAN